MLSGYMRRCSALQIIRAMQIKPTMRSHLTPLRITITKNKKTTNGSEDVEQMNPCTLSMEM